MLDDPLELQTGITPLDFVHTTEWPAHTIDFAHMLKLASALKQKAVHLWDLQALLWHAVAVLPCIFPPLLMHFPMYRLFGALAHPIGTSPTAASAALPLLKHLVSPFQLSTSLHTLFALSGFRPPKSNSDDHFQTAGDGGCEHRSNLCSKAARFLTEMVVALSVKT